MIRRTRWNNVTKRVLAVLTLTTLLAAGSSTSADSCGTRLTPEVAAAMLAIEPTRLQVRPPSERFVFMVPLTIHIVRPSNGIGGLTLADVDETIADANMRWSGSGIQFFRQGPPRFIDSDAFYFSIDTDAEIDALIQTSPVANTINCYFTQNLASEFGSLCGRSTFTFSPVQGIAMKNSCTASSGDSISFAHEIGHYFDLFHTHETFYGVECPSGSNCSTAGDLLCDTPADPDLFSCNCFSYATCTYNGNATACNGQPYAPDVRNIMSYSLRCSSVFSPQQFSRALGTLIQFRSNLVAADLNSTWVDPTHSGPEAGTYSQPFNTLSEAVAAAPCNGRIIILGGTNSPQTGTFTRPSNCPVTIDTFNGPVIIGQ